MGYMRRAITESSVYFLIIKAVGSTNVSIENYFSSFTQAYFTFLQFSQNNNSTLCCRAHEAYNISMETKIQTLTSVYQHDKVYKGFDANQE